ncbi:hypothetical protein BDQ17DRAFT_1327315 [Cyathus striatus]|nr:hypothetical protein BDQ17DRAFT_1327315 [Cyathus striatus]
MTMVLPLKKQNASDEFTLEEMRSMFLQYTQKLFNELKLYIENQIDNSKKIKWLLNEVPCIQKEVVETVLSMSKGMFLAAHLHMDTIHNCISKADVLDTLKKLPPKLNEMYDAAIQVSEVASSVVLNQEPVAVVDKSTQVEELCSEMIHPSGKCLF